MDFDFIKFHSKGFKFSGQPVKPPLPRKRTTQGADKPQNGQKRTKIDPRDQDGPLAPARHRLRVVRQPPHIKQSAHGSPRSEKVCRPIFHGRQTSSGPVVGRSRTKKRDRHRPEISSLTSQTASAIGDTRRRQFKIKKGRRRRNRIRDGDADHQRPPFKAASKSRK